MGVGERAGRRLGLGLEEQRPGRTSAGGARKCWRLLCGRRQETLVTDTADCPASVEVAANDHRG